MMIKVFFIMVRISLKDLGLRVRRQCTWFYVRNFC